MEADVIGAGIEGQLDLARTVPLTLVIAVAGWGKTTTLRDWAVRADAAWLTIAQCHDAVDVLAGGVADALGLTVSRREVEPEALAGVVCRALDRETVLVIDEAEHIVPGSASARFLRALAQGRLHLVLASRREPPFSVSRLRGQGLLNEIVVDQLALDHDAVRRVAGPQWSDSSLLELLRDTAGWPAATRLALTGPAGHQGALYDFLAHEALESEPQSVHALLGLAVQLERFTPELLEALGASNARATLASLSGRGLFVHENAGAYRLTGLAHRYLGEHLSITARKAANARGAIWLEQQGLVAEALGCLRAAGDRGGVERLVREHGETLIHGGAGDDVLEALDAIGVHDEQLLRIRGLALQLRGDLDQALECFTNALAGRERYDADLAWRAGMIHHARGDLPAALDTYERAELDAATPRTAAMLHGWRACARWLGGDVEGCRADAEQARILANVAGDAGALALTHTALALLAAHEGDRAGNDAHYTRALSYAQKAGDMVQLARIRANRGSQRLEEGDYQAALAELELAIRLAEQTGVHFIRALALVNIGSVKRRLGRLDDAVIDLEAAKTIFQQLGSRMVSYALQELGDLYRERGSRELARAALEEAVRHADRGADAQGLVPALAGLALVIADQEPELAQRYAERALQRATGLFRLPALLAVGWLSAWRSEHAVARDFATQALQQARTHRDRAGLADALELAAACAPTRERSARAFTDAEAVWQEIGNPIGVTRCRLGALRTRHADTRQLRPLESQLRTLGVTTAMTDEPPEVAIETLGRFRVLRREQPVATGEWRSRKARDLIKILVGHRGRPVSRDALMEHLWPDADARRLPNRLSVALSTARSVLDPLHAHPSDHYLRADRHAVAICFEHVSVDVENFFASAAAGLRSLDVQTLLDAERQYTGHYLEDHPYDDWAEPLRTAARATYRHVLTEIASQTSGEEATRYHLRLVQSDPWDEGAHIALVSRYIETGQHLTARRAHSDYARRMAEIGREPKTHAELT